MSLIAIGRKNKKAAPQEVVTPDQVKDDEVFVTAAAAAHVGEMAEKEGVPGGVLRVGIKGGGCSGLTYHFAIAKEPSESDAVFERDGARVIVDPKSLKLLGGTILDWDQALGRAGFIVRNPHARSTCSCGESFSI